MISKIIRVDGKRENKKITISDSDKRIYDLYRVERGLGAVLRPSVLVAWFRAIFAKFRQPLLPDTDLTRIPAHFLINPDGTVNTAYYGKTIADHIPWDQVRSFAGGLYL